MKTCVVTRTFACTPAKVWLYMSNPNLNGWRTDIQSAEVSADGMKATEKLKDGAAVEIEFSEKEKNRKMICTFAKGRVRGKFTAILFGGGDSTSVECTMEVDGLGLFAKPQNGLNERMDMLQKALGE